MQLIDPIKLGNDATACSRALEAGNILFFPRVPFEFSGEDRQSLIESVQTGGELHKNIAYRPIQDKVSGLGDARPEATERVRAGLRSFSRLATGFAGELLPHYKDSWRLDYASFRGIEEQGRELSWKKRNDLLHTDAFPTRPTNGDLILRFFVNINPTKERVWVTSDPFASVAGQHAMDAGLLRVPEQADAPARILKRAARAIGLPVIDRSPYDRFMLCFHDYLKMNDEYQRTCSKYRFEFPANSAWMVFTDVVPHAVLSGQFAVEQTFIVSKDSLAEKELAPVRILEKMSNRRLTR